MSILWQNLDKLKVFATVAEVGKINKASELLHLTQPSISRSIQKLEDAFGSALLVRHRDGVTLTPAGKLLYDEVILFLKTLEDIQQRAKSGMETLSGHLSIGTYESLAEYLWPHFLLNLQEQHPQLHLSVKTNQGRDLIANLADGTIDILVDAEPQLQSMMISWPLYKDHFSFYVSTNFKVKILKPIEVQNLSCLYVSGARDENGITIEQHLVKQGYKFAREYCFDSFSTVKDMAMKGLGVAILPARLAYEDKKEKRLQELHMEGFSRAGFGHHTIYMSAHRRNEKDPRIKKIRSLLRAQLQP